jgi:hypothetical protein
LRTTARNAASMFSGSQLASIGRHDHFDLSPVRTWSFTPAR